MYALSIHVSIHVRIYTYAYIYICMQHYVVVYCILSCVWQACMIPSVGASVGHVGICNCFFNYCFGCCWCLFSMSVLHAHALIRSQTQTRKLWWSRFRNVLVPQNISIEVAKKAMAKFNPLMHRFTKQAKKKKQAEKKAAEKARGIWNRAMRKATTELQRAAAYVNRAQAILLKAADVELQQTGARDPVDRMKGQSELGPESCGEAAQEGPFPHGDFLGR